MHRLTSIANKYGTDKGSLNHNYTEIYPKYLPENPNKMMEIGIWKGSSLRMWNEYYPNLESIYGMDFYTDKIHENFGTPTPEEIQSIIDENKKFKLLFTDQSDRVQLDIAAQKIGENELDFILDDGSHNTDDQQISLSRLFKTLKSGGVYIIEDLTDKDYPLGGWNIKDMVNYSDATVNVLDKFNETGKLETPYLTKDETDYLESQIDKIILDLRINHNLAFIFKK